MQWPAVFVPCLRNNRFPAKRQGGLGLFHVIPDTAVASPDRYRGTVEDETRLFYVAVTRAQKSPLHHVLADARQPPLQEAVSVLRPLRAPAVVPHARPRCLSGSRLEPQAKRETPNVTLSFSELKYLFECPYQFKLRSLNGFNPPLHEALGYGRASTMPSPRPTNARSTATSLPGEAEDLVTRHLHAPYAYPELRATLRAARSRPSSDTSGSTSDLERTIHSEKQIQVHVTRGSPSTAESTSSAASTPARSRSSTSGPQPGLRTRT